MAHLARERNQTRCLPEIGHCIGQHTDGARCSCMLTDACTSSQKKEYARQAEERVCMQKGGNDLTLTRRGAWSQAGPWGRPMLVCRAPALGTWATFPEKEAARRARAAGVGASLPGWVCCIFCLALVALMDSPLLLCPPRLGAPATTGSSSSINCTVRKFALAYQ